MRIYAWSAFFIILYESTIWVNDLSWNVNRKQFSRINYVICEIIVPNYETDTDRHPFRDCELFCATTEIIILFLCHRESINLQ